MAAERLSTLVGLTPAASATCVRENNYSFEMALASAIQSLPILPDSLFTDRRRADTNRDEINNLLKAVYAKVKGTGKDEAGWGLVFGPTAAAVVSSSPTAANGVLSLPKAASPATSVASNAGSAPPSLPSTPPPAGGASPKPNPFMTTSKEPKPTTTAAPSTITAKPNPFTSAVLPPTNGNATPAPPKAGGTGFSFTSKTAASPADAAKTTAPANTKAPAGFSFTSKTVTSTSDAAKSTAPASTAAPGAAPPKAGGMTFNFTSKTVSSTSGAPAMPANFGKKPAPKPVEKSEEQLEREKAAAALDPELLPRLPADRYTGCLWDMPGFQKEELEDRCTLFNLDKGFLASTGKEQLRERLLKWVAVAPLYVGDINYVAWSDPDEYFARVIIKDAVRTFFGKAQRDKFAEFLFVCRVEFGDYAQSMAYLAGLCLLVLTERETMAILRKINREYIPGHWKAEATGFATNAWVINLLLKDVDKELYTHLNANNFYPDTYMQKVLCGLCVHVLPFNLLFTFLDKFMAGGFSWLVKFELATMQHFRPKLLKVTQMEANTLFEIMKLDPREAEPSDMVAILKLATDMKVDLTSVDALRSKVYDDIIGPRLARAPKEPVFEPCAVCQKERPKLWCETCEFALCKNCHQNGKGSCSPDHHVEPW